VGVAEPGSVLLRKRLELVVLRQAALYFVVSWYEHVTVQPLVQAAASAAFGGKSHKRFREPHKERDSAIMLNTSRRRGCRFGE
jgi:hypothetical protein